MSKSNLFMASIFAFVIGFVGYATFFAKPASKAVSAPVVQIVQPDHHIRRQIHLGILSADRAVLARIQAYLVRQRMAIEAQRIDLIKQRGELARQSAALAIQSTAIARQGVILEKQAAAMNHHQSEIAALQKEMNHKVNF